MGFLLVSRCNMQCHRETRLIHHVFFPSPFHFFHTSSHPATTGMLLVSSEKSSPRSTHWYIFPCLRAPEQCLSPPQLPHSLHHSSNSTVPCLCSLLTKFSDNIYQLISFQLYPQDTSLPDGKARDWQF